MPTYDASTARCSIIAYKEGLLSAVGHNVRLEVTSFSVKVHDGEVVATFDADSLRAVCAVKDGRDDPDALSAKDRDTIAGYVRKDILESSRFPEIIFRAGLVDADEDEAEVEGSLELHGVTRDVEFTARRLDDHWVARLQLRQSDFGIRPFKALMGALKIKSEIDVELRLPADAVTA